MTKISYSTLQAVIPTDQSLLAIAKEQLIMWPLRLTLVKSRPFVALANFKNSLTLIDETFSGSFYGPCNTPHP